MRFAGRILLFVAAVLAAGTAPAQSYPTRPVRPVVGFPAGGPADIFLLVDLVAEIAPSEAQRRALLADNPKRFYGFGT